VKEKVARRRIIAAAAVASGDQLLLPLDIVLRAGHGFFARGAGEMLSEPAAAQVAVHVIVFVLETDAVDRKAAAHEVEPAGRVVGGDFGDGVAAAGGGRN